MCDSRTAHAHFAAYTHFSTLGYPCLLGNSPRHTQTCAAPRTAGLEHVAFTYNSLVELALAYRQKKNLGIEPTWCVNHGITTSICCQDPDGSNIETQVDNFGDNNGATAFVMAECFKRNPVGIDFDPEDLIRRLESGEDQASIKQRPDAK